MGAQRDSKRAGGSPRQKAKRGWGQRRGERRSVRSGSEAAQTHPSACTHPQTGNQLSWVSRDARLLVVKPRQCWAHRDVWSHFLWKYSHTRAQGAVLGLESHTLLMACDPLPEPAVELPGFTEREDSTALQDPSWVWGDPTSRTDDQISIISGPQHPEGAFPESCPSAFHKAPNRPHILLPTSRPLPRLGLCPEGLVPQLSSPHDGHHPFQALLHAWTSWPAPSSHPQLQLSFPRYPSL